MAAPARLQRAAARRKPPHPRRRVHAQSPSTNTNAGSSGQQGPHQAGHGLQSHHFPGNQVLPLAVNQPAQRRKILFSWLCCGHYGLAAVFWGCLAVVSTFAVFLLDRFLPQDEALAKAIFEENRYQSDVDTKLLCVSLKAARMQLPSSSNLDCDQTFSAPLPARHEILENAVGQVGGPPRGLQSSVLTALILTRDILFNKPLLGEFVVCVLAAVIAWAKSRRRAVKAMPASSLKTEHGPIDDAPSRVTSACSGNDWHCARGLSSNPKSLTLPVESSETACTAPVTLETSTTTWKRSAAGSVSLHDGEEGIPTTTTASAASILISSITRAVSHSVTLAWSMLASMTTADLESRDEGRRLPLTDTNHGDEPKITSRTPEGRQEFSWTPDEGERKVICQKMWFCCQCGMGPYDSSRTPQCLCAHCPCSNCDRSSRLTITESCHSMHCRPHEHTRFGGERGTGQGG